MEHHPPRFTRSKGHFKRPAGARSIRRKPGTRMSPRCFNSRQRIVDALHSYLLDGWKQLPERNRRLLGLDPQTSDIHDEQALTYLAYIFIDCANLTLDRAVAAKRSRMMNG
ncbi:hypothetical protein [Pseudomonas sp. TE3610]